jgi:predicted secreted Zn-dependent protease
VRFSNCVIGVCIAVVCAAPVLGEEGKVAQSIKLLGEEGKAAQNIKLAKYVEQKPALPIEHETHPQVKVKENYQFYDIDGTTPDELRAQMKRNGTTWNDGKVYAALTTWDIRYHYDITHKNGKYQLSEIGTEVDIVFHLPKLVPSPGTPDHLSMSWNTYLGNLKTHEVGHRDLAVRIGEEIYQALASLESSSDKKELDRSAQVLIKAKFKTLKQVQIDYDAETHHGVKQGAVLMDPALADNTPAK